MSKKDWIIAILIVVTVSISTPDMHNFMQDINMIPSEICYDKNVSMSNFTGSKPEQKTADIIQIHTVVLKIPKYENPAGTEKPLIRTGTVIYRGYKERLKGNLFLIKYDDNRDEDPLII